MPWNVNPARNSLMANSGLNDLIQLLYSVIYFIALFVLIEYNLNFVLISLIYSFIFYYFS